jgi:hypothetical protein
MDARMAASAPKNKPVRGYRLRQARDLVPILEQNAKRCETRKLFNLLCNAGAAVDAAAGREAPGAAVVFSMMALHAEDEAGGQGEGMARQARRDRA